MKAHRLILFALCWAVGVASVHARAIRVPQDAPTIQAGLDSLSDGDTVLVSLGTYTEALHAPPLHFVLRGDVLPDTGDYPRPVLDPSPLPGSDTLACLILPAGSHPTIEDMFFRNGAAMIPHFHSDGGIMSWSPDPVFRRVVMDSVFYAFSDRTWDSTHVIVFDRCSFRHIIQSGINSLSELRATDCDFTQDQAVVASGGSHTRITRCRFNTVSSPGDHVLMLYGRDIRVSNCLFEATTPLLGVQIWLSNGLPMLADVQIDSNAFVNVDGSHSPIYVQYNLPPELVVDVRDNVFIDNDVSNFYEGGQVLHAPMPGHVPQYLSTIANNLFIQCTAEYGWASALELCYGANVRENRFVQLGPRGAPAILRLPGEAFSPLDVHANIFDQTGLAFRNDDTLGAPDARWNYWGAASGPFHSTQNPGGEGDTIVGDIDFVPWYPDTSFLLNVPGIGKPLPEQFILEAYPNPFNSFIHLTLTPAEPQIIRVELFNLLGRKVEDLWQGPLVFQKQITFNASGLASGLYFVRVTDTIERRPLAATKLMLLK